MELTGILKAPKNPTGFASWSGNKIGLPSEFIFEMSPWKIKRVLNTNVFKK